MLGQIHDSEVSGGHIEVKNTLHRTRHRVWWPEMRIDIEIM